MREKKTNSQRLLAGKPLAVGALVLSAALSAISFPWLATRAQRASREPVVNVTGVSARDSGSGVVVSITADAPLSRAQTWQDEEGFHVVGYKWVGTFAGVPRGVRVRRVGDSLELVVPARAGAAVTVVPRGNSLDVIVAGGAPAARDDVRATDAAPRQSRRAQSPGQDQSQPQRGGVEAEPKPARAASGRGLSLSAKERSVAAARELLQAGGEEGADARAQSSAQPKGAQQSAAPTTLFKSVQTAGPQSAAQNAQAQSPQTQKTQGPAGQNPTPQNSKDQNSAAGAQPNAANAANGAASNGAASNVAAQGASQQASPAPQSPAQAPATNALTDSASSSGGFGPSLFTLAVVGAFLCVGLAVFLFIYRRRRGAAGRDEGVAAEPKTRAAGEQPAKSKGQGAEAERGEEKIAKPVVKAEASVSLVKQENRLSPPTLTPLVQFGAFRVDQEVDKLVRGEAHSIDVMASRASEDRRAVEASLLKAISSPELIESEKDRARAALEEYGFVARHSAAVLLAPDAYGRSAAARSLGQIKSAASLPFLLEALYDSDTVVRAEAVASLGSLGLPRAIGALLDIARRHPEIPQALVTDALDACSLDALDFQSLGIVGFDGEISELEPVAEVDQLPEWLDDETLSDALERLRSADVEARVAAAHQLSQFQVRRAVDALSLMASDDADASVRAAAVTSLGLINHESVFAATLIAMADESREVRAAAARALSRLNFDRADAYVRVLETADAETLRRTAGACVTAGLARQAMDRLASEDRRQAYEAFSLLSLVARGGQTDVIMHVVKGHPDLNVRLAASRLLALQGDEEVDRRLRQIALEGNTPEKLREAIMEVCDRRRQPRDAAPGGATNESDKSLHGIA
jgi:HEAT repeat protein